MAQVYANKLPSQLGQALARVYLVAGDDELLRDEACQLVRHAAQQRGFDNSEKFVHDQGFDWSKLQEACSALSLFSEQKFLELKLASAKIGSSGSAAMQECISALGDDTVLLVSAPRVEGKPRWVQEIIDSGIYVPIYPLEPRQLPGWLQQRARNRGLQLSQDAAELLAERVEGNLVSAVQELEKLALLSPGNAVDAQAVADSVADSTRFSAFNMLDRAIDGNPRAACKALQKIREEGTEPVAVIGAVAYQLRNLLALMDYASRNQLANGFKAKRVLQRRQAAIGNALSRLTVDELQRGLQLLARADTFCKSGHSQISWMALEAIVLSLSGKPLPASELLDSALAS